MSLRLRVYMSNREKEGNKDNGNREANELHKQHFSKRGRPLSVSAFAPIADEGMRRHDLVS